MKITHYDITVDIPPFEFGNEFDISIRDEIGKIGTLLKKADTRTGVPKLKERVIVHMANIQSFVNLRNAKK